MTQTLTVSCRLDLTDEQVAKIEATLLAFSAACVYINKETPRQITNQLRLHTLVYRAVKDRFQLHANLVTQALKRVANCRQSASNRGRQVKGFRSTSIAYDQRIFSFQEKKWTVSLSLLGGREKGIKLHIGNYQRNLLKDQKPTSATLVRHKNGSFHINIQVKVEEPPPEATDKFLGVDLGCTDIAVTSEGKKWRDKSQQLAKTCDHFSKLRTVLQQKAKKGTRSSRRRCRELVKRLSSHEHRFRSWVNHTVSYQIVKIAKIQNQVIVLEDLTGIRQRITLLPRTKKQWRRVNFWGFSQLTNFLAYKAKKLGVKLIFVNPKYTSKICSNCHEFGKRSGKRFVCNKCGFRCDADWNAAKNIAVLGAFVSRPGGSDLSCELSQIGSGLLKALYESAYIQFKTW